MIKEKECLNFGFNTNDNLFSITLWAKPKYNKWYHQLLYILTFGKRFKRTIIIDESHVINYMPGNGADDIKHKPQWTKIRAIYDGSLDDKTIDIYVDRKLIK